MKQKTASFLSFKTFLAALVFLAVPAASHAATHYSVSTHRHSSGHLITMMAAFEEPESCKATAQDRSADMDANWKSAGSACVELPQMTDEHLRMFDRKDVGKPYIVFQDDNGFTNVVVFTDVPALVLDAMLWKWRSHLEGQGMREVEVVMDPGRKKIFDLIGKTKEKLPAEDAPKLQVTAAAMNAAQAAEPSPPPAMAKPDRLVLANGQALSGKILERRPDGIWFRLDEGTDMLFSNAEVREVLPGSSAE